MGRNTAYRAELAASAEQMPESGPRPDRVGSSGNVGAKEERSLRAPAMRGSRPAERRIPSACWMSGESGEGDEGFVAGPCGSSDRRRG